ncbi:MAG: hypothetical protein GY930_13995 [bacterium]|nr:hypothetical protein [bacterium]
MKIKLLFLAAMLSGSCQPTDSNRPAALREVASRLHQGETVLGSLTLRAASCELLECRLHLDGVRLTRPDGSETTAVSGILEAKGDSWSLEMPGMQTVSSDGSAETIGQTTITWLRQGP